MTDNLSLDDFPDIYDDEDAYAAGRRKAGIRLAGAALTRARRRRKRAAAMLRPVLQAIGAVEYEHKRGKWHYGEAREA